MTHLNIWYRGVWRRDILIFDIFKKYIILQSFASIGRVDLVYTPCSLYRRREKKCLHIDVCLTLSLGLNRNHMHVVLSAQYWCAMSHAPCPARSACVRIKVNLFLQRNIIPLKILKVEMCSQYWPAKYFSAIGRHTNPSIYRCTKILDFRKSLV